MAVSAVIITGCGAEKQPVRKEQVKTESETEEQHLEKEEEPYRFVKTDPGYKGLSPYKPRFLITFIRDKISGAGFQRIIYN